MRGATGTTYGALLFPLIFQSTLLMRGATAQGLDDHELYKFQSTLLMRGATYKSRRHFDGFHISIHAPHARSDEALKARIRAYRISIHAPHARSDIGRHPSASSCWNFNPRSSCEERRPIAELAYVGEGISIHAPHARSDNKVAEMSAWDWSFQSTLLMRGAT